MIFEEFPSEGYVVVDFHSIPAFCRQCAFRQWGLPLGKRRVLSYMLWDDSPVPCSIETARMYGPMPDMADLKIVYATDEEERETLICSAYLAEMNRAGFSRRTFGPVGE